MYNMADNMAPRQHAAGYAAAVAYLRSCSTSSLSDGDADADATDAAGDAVDAGTEEALYEEEVEGRHCSYESLPWQA